MQSIPVQPGLLWKPLDTLHWMEPMSEALQRYFGDRPRHGSNSSIYLGGTNIWSGPKNKKNLGPSLSAGPSWSCSSAGWLPALTSQAAEPRSLDRLPLSCLEDREQEY